MVQIPRLNNEQIVSVNFNMIDVFCVYIMMFCKHFKSEPQINIIAYFCLLSLYKICIVNTHHNLTVINQRAQGLKG